MMKIRRPSSLSLSQSLSISSLLALGLSLGLSNAVGCSGDDEPAAERTPETSISKLPLSAACSACAQDALSTTCSAELTACNANPSCFDVEACLVACPPQDVGCFSDCAQASAQFDDLTSCVFCDTCPAECAGEWQCAGGSQRGTGGGGPTSCDNSGDCNACATCSIGSDCGQQYAQCQANPECAPIVQCVIGCGTDAGCVQDCAAQSPGGAADFEPLASCVLCDSCANDCSTQAWDCGGSSSGTGGGSECEACVTSASVSQCSNLFEACAADPECTEIVACVQQCGFDIGCAQQCASQHPGGFAAFEPLAACSVCDACPAECDGPSWGCP